MQKNITIIGPCVVDVLAGPVDGSVFQNGSMPVTMSKLSFGGDALNESVVLSRMGLNVELVTKVGNDEAGARILDYIRDNQLSTDAVKVEEHLTTGINIVLIDKDGERFFLTNPEGSLRKMKEEDIFPHLDEAADIVSFASIFVSPLLNIDVMERIFRKIKSKPGRILTADVTKAKNGETLEDLKKILCYVDYIFPNKDEIAMLTGEKDPYINAKLLVDAGVSCAVIKNSSKGCIICTPNELIEVSAYPVEHVADTTGAGDCFASGFLWGLANGLSLVDCGRFACASASCAIEVVGATEGICSVDKPMERFKELCKEA